MTEQDAIAFVESRLWANGRKCPHCGVMERSGRLGGASTRPGVWKCYACRKPFTVKVGTIFERSHVPLRIWLQAVSKMAASKTGVSAHALERELGVTLTAAWKMTRRLREAARDGTLEALANG